MYVHVYLPNIQCVNVGSHIKYEGQVSGLTTYTTSRPSLRCTLEDGSVATKRSELLQLQQRKHLCSDVRHTSHRHRLQLQTTHSAGDIIQLGFHRIIPNPA